MRHARLAPWPLPALQLSLSVPLRTRPPFLSSGRPSPVGFNYCLTYLDEELLIGRAQARLLLFLWPAGCYS